MLQTEVPGSAFRSPACLQVWVHEHTTLGLWARSHGVSPEGLPPARQLWSSGSGGRGKNSMPSSDRAWASSLVASP
jgi:hypothetical protein